MYEFRKTRLVIEVTAKLDSCINSLGIACCLSTLQSFDSSKIHCGLDHVTASPATPYCRKLCNSAQINKETGLEIIAFIVLLYMCII